MNVKLGVLYSSGRGNENEENSFSTNDLMMITYVNPAVERGTLTERVNDVHYLVRDSTHRYVSGSGSFSQCILIPQRGALSCVGPNVNFNLYIKRDPRTSASILPTLPASMEQLGYSHRKPLRSGRKSPNPCRRAQAATASIPRNTRRLRRTSVAQQLAARLDL